MAFILDGKCLLKQYRGKTINKNQTFLQRYIAWIAC